ncbi:terpene synthase [Ramicandelaber brevisporus]|nr:terpene synthase [Ramicandelaber brevisporus]
MSPESSPLSVAVDPSRWRLRAHPGTGGRHTWHYLETDEEAAAWPQSDLDKYWLGLPVDTPKSPPAATPMEAARKGFRFFKSLQCQETGHWAGHTSGPMFPIPGFVFGSYITGIELTNYQKTGLIQYLLKRAHPDDGGWGLHIEGKSTVFGTTLNYVALRILGVDADHPAAIKARTTLHMIGGAQAIPSWGKLWLACLNLYDWDGMNPLPSEMWLLPYALPFSPGRFWVHAREAMMSMTQLHGLRKSVPLTPLILSLRDEIFTVPYDSIDWPSQLYNISALDLHTRHTTLFKCINAVVSFYERFQPQFLHSRAMAESLRQLKLVVEHSDGLCVSPVSYALVLVAIYQAEGPESVHFQMLKKRFIDPFWISQDGLLVCSTNGSQLWDTEFVAQAVVETGLAEEDENHQYVQKVLEFLDDAQIQSSPSILADNYRYPTKGAWSFSTREQGYTVSDTTAEALKAIIGLQSLPGYKPLISDQRLFDSVDLLLGMQSSDGGFPSYDTLRAPQWVELINASEIFGKIMVEYNYPECTTSIDAGIRLIMSRQQPNGEWLQEGVEGVFNKSCTLAYPNYKNIFTIWALGRYAKKYGEDALPPVS